MTTAAVSRGDSRTSPLREQPSATPSDRGGDLLEQLTRYIPTEIVAAYAAVVGVLPVDASSQTCSSDFTARWVAVGAFAVLTPIAVQALYVIKRRSFGGNGPKFAAFEASIALVAFLAWAAILPLAPLLTWCSWVPSYGAAIGITMLMLIGLAGRLYETSEPKR
jgi:hypothetical protein